MSAKTILLVEDNPSDIDLTKRALEKAHIMNDLVVAENGEEALDYLFGTGRFADRNIRQLPAMVLMDIKLPGLNGIEVLKCIRENPITHRQPVIILTSSKEENDIKSSYNLGVNSYIHKPVDFYQFAEVIQHLGQYWLALNEVPPAG